VVDNVSGEAATPLAEAPKPRDPWLDLIEELDAWQAQGLQVRFWWRDDDAVTVSPTLDRLLDLSSSYTIPVGLAVIPQKAQAELATELAKCPLISVLQHGIAHTNHAPPGSGPPIELGGTLSLDRVADGLVEAGQRLSAMFGASCLPVLVPPWNQIPDELVGQLPGLGYRGLSAGGVRRKRAEGLVESHGHIQPIDWRGRPHFAGTEIAMEKALWQLRQKRLGKFDREEPIGLLTHHLVTDNDTWNFVHCLIAVTRGHPASAWLTPEQAFEIGGGQGAGARPR
jgi:hypothetical protein